MKVSVLQAGIALVILPLYAASPTAAQTAPPVPAEYRALYAELELSLSEAERFHGDLPPARTAVPTLYSTELLAASTNRGEDLLRTQTLQGVILWLDRLKELGFGGVTLSIQYPFLLPRFPRSAEYLGFFKRVVAECRARQLRVVIELGSVFRQPEFSRTRVDYSGLTFEQYQRELREMASVVLRELQPDYLTVLNEPDTTGENLGLSFAPENTAELVRYVLRDLRRGRTRIGAGAGTWSPLRFFELLAERTSVDYLDLHIYPIQRDYVTGRIRAIAALAARHGKRLAASESWLYKASLAELGRGVASTPGLFARDVFSFWQPLDARFIRLMTQISRAYSFEHCSYFWSRYFFGQLEYSPATRGLTPAEAFEHANRAAVPNVLQGKATPLGESLREILRHSR